MVELRKHNIAVFFLPFKKVGLVGTTKSNREVAFTARKGRKVIVFVDTERSPDEALFDICHELAHLVSAKSDTENTEEDERLCNAVAIELVYPSKLLKNNLPSIDHFLNASATPWKLAYSSYARLAQEFDWSPKGLALALREYELIKDKSHEFNRLMKPHSATNKARKPIEDGAL